MRATGFSIVIARGRASGRELPGLVEYFDRRYRRRKMKGASPRSSEQYQIALRKFEAWGTEPTVAISDDQIDDVLSDMLDAGYARAYVNHHRAHCLAVVRDARKKLDLGLPPDVEKVPEYLDAPTAWNPAEMGLLLESARGERGRVGLVAASCWWPALILAVYDSGARISAVMSARTATLPASFARVYIEGRSQKNRRGRWYDLHQQTREALRSIGPHGRLSCVFGDWPYDRTCWQWPALNHGLRRILRRAGLECGRRDLWHKIRRTTGTWIAARLGRAAACDFLGHCDPSVTDRYLDPRYVGMPVDVTVLPRPGDP